METQIFIERRNALLTQAQADLTQLETQAQAQAAEINNRLAALGAELAQLPSPQWLRGAGRPQEAQEATARRHEIEQEEAELKRQAVASRNDHERNRYNRISGLLQELEKLGADYQSLLQAEVSRLQSEFRDFNRPAVALASERRELQDRLISQQFAGAVR